MTKKLEFSDSMLEIEVTMVGAHGAALTVRIADLNGETLRTFGTKVIVQGDSLILATERIVLVSDPEGYGLSD